MYVIRFNNNYANYVLGHLVEEKKEKYNTEEEDYRVRFITFCCTTR